LLRNQTSVSRFFGKRPWLLLALLVVSSLYITVAVLGLLMWHR